MKVIILGAGVIGVTTAYILAERGHEVTVIDRQPGPAMETSFANGGQLSYSHAEPWANPHVLPKILQWSLRSDSPLFINPVEIMTNWQTISWGLGFLRNCTSEKTERNTENTLRLALYSKSVLADIIKKTQIDFNHKQQGILHIFQEQKSLDNALNQIKLQKQLFDCPYEELSSKKCKEKESALNNTSQKIVGGIFCPLDESGDPHVFTEKLAQISTTTDKGVNFIYGTNVKKIIKDSDKITEIETDTGNLKSDHFIVCLGSYSPILLNKIGIKLPIYPMKGYSISIPCTEGKNTPEMSITDQEKKIVYSRLGNVLRVAGTAEFSGYNTEIIESRVASIVKAVRDLFPMGGDFDNIKTWACLRPSTPQGSPYLGKTKYKNLFLNTGHGTLGWTLAAGSCKVVADIVENKEPEIDLKGLTI